MQTPEPLTTRIKRIASRPVVVGLLAFSGGAFWVQTVIDNFNAQKCHSSIFKSLIYELKRNPASTSLFGPDLHYDPKKHSRVKGNIDSLKGIADVEFTVQGSQGLGKVKFVGHRYKNTDFWVSKELVLTKGDKIISLD